MIASKTTTTPELLAFATRVYDAARQGQLDIFQQALPAGLPANLTNEKGDTLIMLAAYHGHDSVVSLLLSHGADPNIINDRGQSPLAGAVFKSEGAVVEALLEGGADPDLGSPSAMETAELFSLQNTWASAFEKARQDIKAKSNRSENNQEVEGAEGKK